MGISDAVTAFAVLPGGNALIAARPGYDGWSFISTAFAGDSEANLYVVKPGKPGDAAGISTRIDVNMAVFGKNNLEQEIAGFNAKNRKYRIMVTEYEMDGEAPNFRPSSEVVAKFNTAILTGNPPDIIVAPGILSLDDYIAKGVLEDLYPYLDGDEELGGRSALVSEVLRAYEVGGALYQMPLDFSISTVVGLTGTLGGRTSWTLEEIISMARDLPAGSAALPNLTSDQVLDSCCARITMSS